MRTEKGVKPMGLEVELLVRGKLGMVMVFRGKGNEAVKSG